MKAQDLIDKFEYALDNHWGYIYGMSHEKWNAEKQADYVRKYKDDPDRQMSCEYGSKWYGHWVTDCSGLFKWAYSQYGLTIAHGSNSIWNNYLTSKGTLKQGKRTDGEELKPGTAVFTTSGNRHNHIGLYIGNGYVIEARGTQYGVVMTKITDSRWTAWGELRSVQYDSGGGGETMQGKVWADTGKTVNLRKAPDIKSALVDQIPIGTECEILEQQGSWDKIVVCGRVGWMMSQYIKTVDPIPLYEVTIKGLDLTQAKALVNNYPGSTYKEMS